MNIAEILKNCPAGIKLYSPIYGEMEFRGITTITKNIHCLTKDGKSRYFCSDGKFADEGECVLFPSKEQRDWNKFLIPFKNGDVIISTDTPKDYPHENMAIFMEYQENDETGNKMVIYCQIDALGIFIPEKMNVTHENWRKANAEETQRFIAKINELGYDFKDGNLTRNFKYGDVIVFDNETYRGYNIGIFDKYLNDTFCKVLCITLVSDGSVKIVDEKYDIGKGWDTKKARYATHSEKLDLLEKLANIGYEWNNKLVPIAKFKVGDTITNGTYTFKISHIDDMYYYEETGITVNRILIQKQDQWRIKKFDVRSLKPYDKVLVRTEEGAWYPSIISYVTVSKQVYLIDSESSTDYVIPFEGNEHLIGRWDDPDSYYITWE